MSISSEINRIETEVENQTDLINQIKTALEGKAAGGGGSVETCEVTVSGSSSSYYPTIVIYTTVDSTGKISSIEQAVSTSSVTVTCVKGSTLAVKYTTLGVQQVANITWAESSGLIAVYYLGTDYATASITNAQGGVGGGSG